MKRYSSRARPPEDRVPGGPALTCEPFDHGAPEDLVSHLTITTTPFSHPIVQDARRRVKYFFTTASMQRAIRRSRPRLGLRFQRPGRTPPSRPGRPMAARSRDQTIPPMNLFHCGVKSPSW